MIRILTSLLISGERNGLVQKGRACQAEKIRIIESSKETDKCVSSSRTCETASCPHINLDRNIFGTQFTNFRKSRYLQHSSSSSSFAPTWSVGYP
jgi:hypothetical protein